MTAGELRALGRDRAAAIAAALTADGALPSNRVRVLEPVAAATKAGSQRIEAELKLNADAVPGMKEE